MGKSKQADSVGDVVNGIERIAEAEDEVSIDDLLDEFGDRQRVGLVEGREQPVDRGAGCRDLGENEQKRQKNGPHDLPLMTPRA